MGSSLLFGGFILLSLFGWNLFLEELGKKKKEKKKECDEEQSEGDVA